MMKRKVNKTITEVIRFLRENRNDIADFLLSDFGYNNLTIEISRFSSGEPELDLVLHQDNRSGKFRISNNSDYEQGLPDKLLALCKEFSNESISNQE